MKKEGKGKALPFFCFLIFTISLLTGAEYDPSLPRIQRLDSRDTAFAQYLSDVESGRQQIFPVRNSNRRISDEDWARTLAEDLTIYVYKSGTGDDVLGLAARCSIPYSAIATINRLSNPEDLQQGQDLILPSIPGLFIPETPGNELERLLNSSRDRENGVIITISNGNARTRYLFLPGEDFNPTERTFFLNRGFYFPLKNFRITSNFGPRTNPVTGIHGLHQGLDLAAPEGTEVFAAREGTVMEQGEDPVLGRYIILSHKDNWVSLYGHLSKIDTVLNQLVNSSSLIGRVGTTGQSTGPHLHFELRQNGTARDPVKLLRLFQGN